MKADKTTQQQLLMTDIPLQSRPNAMTSSSSTATPTQQLPTMADTRSRPLREVVTIVCMIVYSVGAPVVLGLWFASAVYSYVISRTSPEPADIAAFTKASDIAQMGFLIELTTTLVHFAVFTDCFRARYARDKGCRRTMMVFLYIAQFASWGIYLPQGRTMTHMLYPCKESVSPSALGALGQVESLLMASMIGRGTLMLWMSLTGLWLTSLIPSGSNE